MNIKIERMSLKQSNTNEQCNNEARNIEQCISQEADILDFLPLKQSSHLVFFTPNDVLTGLKVLKAGSQPAQVQMTTIQSPCHCESL